MSLGLGPGPVSLRCHAEHLEKFRHTAPQNELYDLSANVAKRKRVELADRTA